MTNRKKLKELREKLAWLEHLLKNRDRDIDNLHKENEVLLFNSTG